jgi:hypothetical protein
MDCMGEMLVDAGVRMGYDRRVHVRAANKYLNWITKHSYHLEISTQAASRGYLALLNRLRAARVCSPTEANATLAISL